MSAFAIAVVELRRFLRDRANLFFVFALPLLLVVFIGAQFAGGARIELGVVHDTTDPVTQSVVEAVSRGDDIALVVYEDRDALVEAVARARLSGGIVLPDDLALRLSRLDPVEIAFVGRPDERARALQQVVASAAAEVARPYDAARVAAGLDLGEPSGLITLATELADQIVTPELEVEAVGGDPLAQEFAGLGQFDLGASSQLFLFVFLTSLAASAALIQSRQLGVARRMLSTPTSASTIVVGQAFGRLAVALTQALYLIVATTLLFQVNWGDPLATGLVVVLFCLVAAGAAMLVGSVARNDSQATGVGVGLGLVLAALGGSMAPLEIFPATMQRVALVTPHAWANNAMAEIVRRGGGVSSIATELTVLAVYAGVLFLLAGWLLRRALTR